MNCIDQCFRFPVVDENDFTIGVIFCTASPSRNLHERRFIEHIVICLQDDDVDGRKRHPAFQNRRCKQTIYVPLAELSHFFFP